MQVAHATRVHARQSLSAHHEHLATLRALRNRQRQRASDTRHIDISAEYGLRIREQHFAIEIFAVALEAFIFDHFEDDDDITARTAAHPGIPHAAQMHVLPRRDAGRNLDLDVVLAALTPFSAARLTGRGNHHPFATARGTGRDAHELAKEALLRAAHFTLPSAGRATRRLRPLLRPRAGARVAGVEQLDLHVLRDAGRDLEHRQLEIHLHISARARPLR